MQSQSLVRKSLRLIRSLMGQKRFYRAARALMYEAQFDVLNDPLANGERYIQEVVLHSFTSPIIFDVGANVGDWTASVLRQQGTSDVIVHAFEPCRGTFEILQKRATQWKGVSSARMALSDEIEMGKLAVHGDCAGDNHVVSEECGEWEEVRLCTVDAYCQQERISHINLLKVDTEGHDLRVLVGTRVMLKAAAVDIIQFEYNHCWISERKLLRDAFEYLQPLGYCIGKLTGDAIQFYANWHWEMETYREANYVALLPQFAGLFRSVPPNWIP